MYWSHFFLTVVSVVICSNNKLFSQLYSALIKDAMFFIWLISFCLVSSVIVRKRKKSTIILLSLFFSLVQTIQLIFIYGAFNFIEIQHYFSWQYNITYPQVVYRDIAYDFAYGEFRYLLLFAILIAICWVRVFVNSEFFKRKCFALFGIEQFDDEDDDYSDLDDFELYYQNRILLDKTPEKNTMDINSKTEKLPSRGKINSRARAIARQARKAKK